MPFDCRKCGKPSAVVEISRGYQCRDCTNEARRAYYALRVAEGRPLAQTHKRTPEAEARAHQRRYADPVERQHIKARSTAATAIKRGKLIRQPCEVCADPQVEAHHDDYRKPLSVRWLCTTHHREHHKAERARAAA